MNILPKKRWHVRTKENIARVRRDEAQAAEEERIKQERAKLAESESKRQYLLEKSRKRFKTETFVPIAEKNSLDESNSVESEHVNFFKELEEGTAEQKQTNKEHDEEVKNEKEKYEKQIGYLTYLGQDTNEALGKKSWYEIAPKRKTDGTGEINLKAKVREDPLNIIKKFTISNEKSSGETTSKSKYTEYKSLLHTELKHSSKSKKRNRHSSRESSEERANKKHKHKRQKKHKKRKHRSSSESSVNEHTVSSISDDEDKLQEEKNRKLSILRAERLKREQAERRKTEELLAKIRGDNIKEGNKNTNEPRQKYNSQFNPYLAKQNFT
ncbi:leukocyte receptor cluster member 1 homolog [Sitophilus oryzae]|uniref:Leukocyte receptor cluster member 1 homolog n=1 Tax=Sitophilus oryzae TaxID=7048 RepID=A0A6J2YC20_SITOR|nr:leukocyte receptor cluster member 1 homolog [Sitophilus oryzae]